jgi:hypothetical protein
MGPGIRVDANRTRHSEIMAGLAEAAGSEDGAGADETAEAAA